MRRLLIGAGFAAFFVLFFAPVDVRDFLTSVGDGDTLALPAYLTPHALWEPNLMLGYPWSSALGAYWYPLWQLHWIPGSFNAYMICAYVLAAVGMWGFIEAATGSSIAAAFAAFAYSLGGFMIGHLGHYDVVHPAAWPPFVFWALVEIRRMPRPGPVIGGAVALGLCATAGQPQVLTYTVLVVLAWIVTMRRAVLASSAMLFLGLGLGGIALGPGWELAHFSYRATLPFAEFARDSQPVWEIPLRLFFPYALGVTHSSFFPLSSVSIGNWAELNDYVGIETMILAALAVLVPIAKIDVLFWTGVAVAGLLLSTGNETQLAQVTYHVPLINFFRVQGRHAFEVTFALATLGAYGAAALVQRRASLTRGGCATAGVGVVMLAELTIHPASEVLANRALWLPIVVFAFAAGSVMLWAARPQARWPAVIAAAVAAADVAGMAHFGYWRWNPVEPAQLQPPPYVAALLAVVEREHQRVLTLSTTQILRPNIPLLWGLTQTSGYVSLLLQRPGVFLQMDAYGATLPALLDRGDPTLDASGTRFVAAAAGSSPAASLLSDPAHWRIVETTADTVLVENRRAYPRAWIVHELQPASGPNPIGQMRALRTGAFSLRNVAFVEPPAAMHDAAGAGESVEITAYAPTKMSLSVTCATECFLITSDAWYDGWHATVDGKSTPVSRADYALRGAVVPPGHHLVTFWYFPITLFGGAGITVLSAAALAFLSLRMGRRRRILEAPATASP